MTGFLIKTFIKKHSDIDNPSVRSAYGKLAGKVGIACNVLLCIGKFIAGIVSGSLSISADAVNNLSDASSSIISLIGFKLSEKSPDKEHPYGHGRYEYLAGFMVAALIIVIGAELLRDSIIKIIKPTEVEFGMLPIAVLSVSVLVKLWMMLFYLKIAKRINSETLKASSADSRNDVFSTLAVLAALIISHFTGINLDGIMGAAVAVIILISGIGLVKDAINPLLGKAPSEETVEEIRRKILAYDGVLGTHDLMIHDYGPGRMFASVHVEVFADMPLMECHDIIDEIERDFLNSGMNMLVHPDPIVRGDTVNGKTAAAVGEIMRSIDERISVHDVRVWPGDGTPALGSPEPRKVMFDCVLPPDIGISRREIEKTAARLLGERFGGCLPVITFDDGYASIPHSKPDER